MTDEARAQKLYFELSAATMREPYHDSVADILLIAAAFAAVREACAKQAEFIADGIADIDDYNKGIAAEVRKVAQAIRTRTEEP